MCNLIENKRRCEGYFEYSNKINTYCNVYAYTCCSDEGVGSVKQIDPKLQGELHRGEMARAKLRLNWNFIHSCFCYAQLNQVFGISTLSYEY